MTFLEIEYQRQLIESGLDDSSPNAVFPHFCGGQFGENPEVWKREVIEFLTINVSCGLLEAIHRKDLVGREGARVLEDMLTKGDVDTDFDAKVIWETTYFAATPKLDELLESLNLRTWEALNLGPNAALIARLKELYAQC